MRLDVVAQEQAVAAWIDHLNVLRFNEIVRQLANQDINLEKVKEELIAYKGGKCEICGYNKCIAALEFHHINPEEKDFAISNSNIYKNIEALKQEIDKCMLVCANCHRELHYQQDNN